MAGNPLTGDYELVDKLSHIRQAYISSLSPWTGRSLLWDLASAFPFIQVSCAIWNRAEHERDQGSSSYLSWLNGWQLVQALSLLRVTKLWRLWKIAEVAEQITRQSPGMANLVTLVQMLFILFFAAHYLGCAWFAVGNVPPDSEEFQSSWTVLEGNFWFENDDGTVTRRILMREDGWLYEWLTAIYFAIATMTTIGYGDISAHNNAERIFCMVAMTLGSAYFAWLAGTVTGILAKGSAGTERFLAFLDEVRQFLDIKRFSEDVKRMVFIFYGLKYPTQLIFDDEAIIQSLPKGLRKKMHAETYMALIEMIPLFATLSETVKIDVSRVNLPKS